MRGLLILAISLWAAGATAEEKPRREEFRAALLEALEVQASLPEQLPRLPEAASPVVDSARETAAQGARQDSVARTRSEASERAARMVERTPPGASIRAARSAALGAAGAEAQDAAGRSRAEQVRKNKDPKHDSPGNGRPSQPEPIRRP